MMDNSGSQYLQPCALGIAFLAVTLHLTWEYTHGGVVSHHLFDRKDLPAISNWWGLVALPVLGLLASRSVAHRLFTKPAAMFNALAAFGGALAVGLALSTAFATGHQSAASSVFLAALISGFVLPTYRAEYWFGFVLGMTFVFGSVLPTMVALVAAAISVTVHFFVLPAAAWTVRRVRA